MITVWTKPLCVQCNAVKRRLVEQITGQTGLTLMQLAEKWQLLKDAGKVLERDLTAPENEESLQHFKGLGYTSAPITEYGPHAVPGYIPDEIDALVIKAGLAA